MDLSRTNQDVLLADALDLLRVFVSQLVVSVAREFVRDVGTKLVVGSR